MEPAGLLPDQDFMLDMDFDEYIPVDNFFNQYLQNCVHREQDGAMRSDSGGQDLKPALQDAQHQHLSTVRHDASVSTMYAQPSSHLLPPATLAADHGKHAALHEVFEDPAAAAAASHLGVESGTLTDLCDVAPLPQAAAPAHPLPVPPVTSPNIYNTLPAGKFPPAVSLDSLSDPAPGPHVLAAGGGVHKNKSERQQMLNKAAQQRYRERKKAKAQELEQAVAHLQDKVEELKIVQAEKEALRLIKRHTQLRVHQLEKEALERDAQLTQLRQEAQLGEQACSGQTVCSADTPPDMSAMIQRFHTDVAALRSFMTQQGYLRDVEVVFDDMPRNLQTALAKLVETCYQTCVRVHRLVVDVDTFGMIEASIDQKRHHLEGDAQTWEVLVPRLNLTEAAREKAGALREQFLTRLESVYVERQGLNMEAVKALLPQEYGGGASGRASWFSFKGFFKRHKHANRVASVVARLKANLVEEQKTLGELDYLVLVRLLDPLQAARCVVATYPLHCDAISLLNAIRMHASNQPAADTQCPSPHLENTGQ